MSKKRLTAAEKAELKRQKNLEKQHQKQRGRQRRNDQRKAASRDKRLTTMRVINARSRQLHLPTQLHNNGTLIHDSVPYSSHLQENSKPCVSINLEKLQKNTKKSTLAIV